MKERKKIKEEIKINKGVQETKLLETMNNIVAGLNGLNNESKNGNNGHIIKQQQQQSMTPTTQLPTTSNTLQSNRDIYNKFTAEYIESESFDPEWLQKMDSYCLSGDNDKNYAFWNRFSELISRNISMDKVIKILKCYIK